jgi:diadenosine tetraphosphate (Ap4A) HIT family hydrolase
MMCPAKALATGFDDYFHNRSMGGPRLAENTALTEFREKFRVEDLLIIKTEAWSWSVRPLQPTLGAGVLSLNREAASFSEVTPAEMAEMATLIATLEKTLKTAFAYDRINYLMLMMVDHQVHFHVIPRYESGRQFAGLEWVDAGWPALPVLADCQHRDAALMLIRDSLRAASTS